MLPGGEWQAESWRHYRPKFRVVSRLIDTFIGSCANRGGVAKERSIWRRGVPESGSGLGCGGACNCTKGFGCKPFPLRVIGTIIAARQGCRRSAARM